jgi:fructuronate reductase
MSRPHLSLAALDHIGHTRSGRRRAWTGPALDPRSLRVGIVHLGIGAFHRAHQAVLTELAAAASGRHDWGITGVTQRSARVRDQLMAQDGLYSIVERGPGSAAPRVVGSIREVLHAPADPAAVTDRIADPATRIVTLTVTEKGYRRGNGGRLDLSDPGIIADLTGRPPGSVVGQLVAGLRRRMTRDGGPLTVLSCDNLVGNGTVLCGLVDDFVGALPPAQAGPLADWVAASVRFPCSVVDRIVPATTAADREAAAAILGLHDAGVVMTEPYCQWVIEDDFAGDRPLWELAGAVLTQDVSAWEAVKLRMLNATHSLLAYGGALLGHETIAQAVADERLAAEADALMTVDVAPTLPGPDGLDLAAYRRTVLERFANPEMRHRTAQVAMDGSQKLPVRLLGTVRDRLAAGAMPTHAAFAIAAWMTYVARGRDLTDRLLPLEDPLAVPLRRAAAAGTGDPRRLVRSMLGITEIFGTDLRDHDGFRDELANQVARLDAGW